MVLPVFVLCTLERAIFFLLDLLFCLLLVDWCCLFPLDVWAKLFMFVWVTFG